MRGDSSDTRSKKEKRSKKERNTKYRRDGRKKGIRTDLPPLRRRRKKLPRKKKMCPRHCYHVIRYYFFYPFPPSIYLYLSLPAEHTVKITAGKWSAH